MTKIVREAAKPKAKASPSSAQHITRILQDLRTVESGALSEERYEDICARVLALRRADRPAVLYAELARASGKSVAELRQMLHGAAETGQRQSAAAFDTLVPTRGWIADYLEWTRQTEAPSVFHFFVAATVLGNALGRRVFFDKGYHVFPNLSIMLIAPAGRCKKTSAADLGIGLLTQAGGRLSAEKPTPEALVDSLKSDATALVYAPELAVFLGKQRYQDGMVPLLTRLLDSPKEWKAGSIGRGETTLFNVGISTIMCSTLDWMQTAIPADVFGGGFMSRFLLIVQEDTDRCFPKPPSFSKEMRASLIKRLATYRLLKAETYFPSESDAWHDAWYRRRRASRPQEGAFSGYYERKPDHMIRLATILEVSQLDRPPADGRLPLPLATLQQAERILSWIESWLPSAFDRFSSSTTGEDQDRLIRQLRQSAGRLDHSTLLRRNSSRLNAEQFRRAIATLVEAGLVEWDKDTRAYYLTAAGWGAGGE